MTSRYPPRRTETAIEVLGFYEEYLIQLQEQDSSLKVKEEEIKIKKGDTFRYLTESTWKDGLNKLDCRCMFCLEQILEDEDIVHTKCACKPLPVIHAKCLLELKQYGERTVNGQESNKSTDEEKKFLPSFVVECSLCKTPFLGKKMLNLVYEATEMFRNCDPQTTAEDELNDTTAKGNLLLVGIMKLQNVLKSILTSWHTSSDFNPTLGQVLAVLSEMHLAYANIVRSEYNTHSFAGRMCMVAAIHTYGPGMTVWGVGGVKFLLKVCKLLVNTSVSDPNEMASQRHAVPEIIHYVKQAMRSAPESWQVDVHQEACKSFFTSLTELEEDDIFRKEWLLPCFPDEEIKVVEEKKKAQLGSGERSTLYLLLHCGGSDFDHECVGDGDDGSASDVTLTDEKVEEGMERQQCGVSTSSRSKVMSEGNTRRQPPHEFHSCVRDMGGDGGCASSVKSESGAGKTTSDFIKLNDNFEVPSEQQVRECTGIVYL